MKTLRDCIQEASSNHYALGHFNISTVDQLHAIYAAAKDLGVPVIIGTSEGERNFLGLEEAVALVRTIRERDDYPIFLNADHTYSVEAVKQAIDAGYDAVIFDGAKLTLEENILATKECVDYARESGRDVLVEGELGYIGSGSELLEGIPAGAAVTEAHLTTPHDANHFVVYTGVDLLAPTMGNIHGMLKGANNPRLFIDRISAEREAAGVPLVLHGGSGIVDEDFRAAIKAGVAIVHINTEIRVAWRRGLEAALAKDPDKVSPYKLLARAEEAVQEIVTLRLRLFSSLQ